MRTGGDGPFGDWRLRSLCQIGLRGCVAEQRLPNMATPLGTWIVRTRSSLRNLSCRLRLFPLAKMHLDVGTELKWIRERLAYSTRSFMVADSWTCCECGRSVRRVASDNLLYQVLCLRSSWVLGHVFLNPMLALFLCPLFRGHRCNRFPFSGVCMMEFVPTIVLSLCDADDPLEFRHFLTVGEVLPTHTVHRYRFTFRHPVHRLLEACPA